MNSPTGSHQDEFGAGTGVWLVTPVELDAEDVPILSNGVQRGVKFEAGNRCVPSKHVSTKSAPKVN